MPPARTAKRKAKTKAKTKSQKARPAPTKRAAPTRAAAVRRPGPPGPSPLPNPYLGQVELFAFDFAPQGWAPCNGQLLPISQNVALFQLIGKTYGGNGVSTFALPNLPPRGPSGPHYFIALEGVIPPH
jgi:hypothetical protein